MIVIPVVLVLLGAMFSASGNAGTATPEAPWPGPYICSEGTLTSINAGDSPNGRMLAQIEPCAGADPARVAEARWGVAFYRDTRVTIDANSGTFHYQLDGPTYRNWELTPGDLTPGEHGRIRAACIVVSQPIRRACVQIDAVDGALVITPLPTTDPLVARKVFVTDNDTPNPICAGCV
ncbi:hypothetical protein [Paractinoplanes rishiriensis]|uniref:hypothetical protein n=1 Tax=Paractinoplanes rishiriensis TaxID=1050105 RepID=UPI001944A251|nr:hypothetical protein [Actinoplanes rishiriensis]